MDINLKVKRYNPEANEPPFYQDFQVEMPDYVTVLDALMQVREYEDDSLTLRCSCRSAICGSCSMRINGRARLACKTKAIDLAPNSEEIVVEPAGNMPVIKDLVSDMKPFWDKVKAIEPWLQPSGPPPEKEYIAPNEAMQELAGVMNCIMCGACVSDCTALEVDKTFLGPAALAKAFRFVEDPRDDAREKRLGKLSKKSGVWDCTHCFECVEVCPKGVAPMERIMAMRGQAIEEGHKNNKGTRHMDSFANSVKHSGHLNEGRLAVESQGYLNLPGIIPLIPVGLRALAHNKMPSPIHKPRPGAKNVKRIFQKLDKEAKDKK